MWNQAMMQVQRWAEALGIKVAGLVDKHIVRNSQVHAANPKPT